MATKTGMVCNRRFSRYFYSNRNSNNISNLTITEMDIKVVGAEEDEVE